MFLKSRKFPFPFCHSSSFPFIMFCLTFWIKMPSFSQGFCSILMESGRFGEYIRISGKNNSNSVVFNCKQPLHVLDLLQRDPD